MKATGKVIETIGKRARVESVRSSACSSCHECEARGACHAELIFGSQTQSVIIETDNRIGAKVGDTVEIESSSSKTLAVSAVVFIIPIILSVIAYVIANKTLTDLQSALVLLITLLISFFVFLKLMNRFVKTSLASYIVKISEESEKQVES